MWSAAMANRDLVPRRSEAVRFLRGGLVYRIMGDGLAKAWLVVATDHNQDGR
jgi:hypothetical protein